MKGKRGEKDIERMGGRERERERDRERVKRKKRR